MKKTTHCFEESPARVTGKIVPVHGEKLFFEKLSQAVRVFTPGSSKQVQPSVDTAKQLTTVVCASLRKD